MSEHMSSPQRPACVGFCHRFATIESVRLHYVTAGVESAEPLILLAGYPETWFAWRRVMPLLADRFRLIAIDLPGQGDSDKPLDGYDTSTVARRIHGLIAKLGI